MAILRRMAMRTPIALTAAQAAALQCAVMPTQAPHPSSSARSLSGYHLGHTVEWVQTPARCPLAKRLRAVAGLSRP
ncbi:MAG: hypothetical protein ACK40S_04215 [Burkholderiaceae bacterium]